jgi:hypothetical protein
MGERVIDVPVALQLLVVDQKSDFIIQPIYNHTVSSGHDNSTIVSAGNSSIS